MATTGEPFGLFWDSENGDRTYSAASFEYWLKKFFTSGVFNGDLQVKAKSGMTLEIDPGYTNVDGKVKFWNGAFTVTLDAANSTYPRIDTIIIRRDNVNRQITCEKVTGSYSADTPQPTAPIRNSEIHDLVTAQIYVGAGVTEITQSNITDTRPNNELCGYITGTVEELDFSAFTAQFEAYFAEFKRNQMADFQAWEVAQQAAYAAWFSLVQQQQVQDKADWDAWYAALQEELHELPEDTAEYLQIQIDEIRTSGTTGSILKISTTETSLEGKTVTVTNGTETRTATFDENLECLIAGYKGTGEVTISSSDGIQTASTVVTIPYFGNYQYAIAFWAATVNIQGDDNLKGATITVKDSDDLTVGTVVLNVITGRGVFTAQKADTYTFNFTYQGTDYSESLIVDEQITYSLSLSAGFNWRGWVDTAQYLDSTDYNSLDEVLADELAVRELCLEHACVDYLARVASATADIETIINNDLFAKWVNNSDYSLDILGANVAIKALMDTADKYGYGEWALVGQVPKMTSNSAPYGEATAYNSFNSGTYQAYKAFDGDTSTKWVGGPGGTTSVVSTNAEIGYHSTSAIKVNRIKIKYNLNTSSPITCTLRGSNDGINWSNIGDSVTLPYTSPSVDEIHEFDFVNSTSYEYNELLFSGLNDAQLHVYDLQFYAWAPKGNVPVMTSNTAPYGEVVGSSVLNSGTYYYSAFDGDESSVWHSAAGMPQYIGYKATNPMKLKACRVVVPPVSTSYPNTKETFKIQGSNDGFVNDVHDLTEPQEIAFRTDGICSVLWVEVDSEDYYLHHRVYVTDSTYQSASYKYAQFREIQFYGRELSVSVPTMDTNTTPYGEAFSSSNTYSANPAYKAFDNDFSTYWGTNSSTTGQIGYKFPSKMVLKKFHLDMTYYNIPYTCQVKGSNDGVTYDNIGESFTIDSGTKDVDFASNNTEYEYIRLDISVSTSMGIVAESIQFYGLDYSEKEFEEGTTKKWLYDHGLELETLTFDGSSSYKVLAENDGNDIHLKSSGGAAGVTSALAKVTVDLTSYSLVRCKVGNVLSTNESGGRAFIIVVYTIGSTTDNKAVLQVLRGSSILPNNLGLDISSINGRYDLDILDSNNSGAESKVSEWWLE